MRSRDPEDLVENLVSKVISEFRESGYPHRPLSLSVEDFFEIEIRIPPSAPKFLREKYESVADQFRACPSIEVIKLPEEIRGLGLFSKLVSRLGKEPHVECICVSNVSNVEFSNYLATSDKWREIDVGGFNSLRSYYKLSA